MMKRKSFFYIFIIATTLAGCSSPEVPNPLASTAVALPKIEDSIATSVVPGGLPSDAIIAVTASDSDQKLTQRQAGWIENGAEFALVFEGSSSCPSYPSSIEATDLHTLQIGIETLDGPHCTDDMSQQTFIISTPTSIDITQQVTITYVDGTTTTLPALQKSSR